MRRAELTALAAAVALWAAGAAAQERPSDMPEPIFEWAVAMDLAVVVEANCSGMSVDRARADTTYGVAVAAAFPDGADYVGWSARQTEPGRQADMRRLVALENVRRGAAAGYDLTDTAQLCAYGRAQRTAGTAPGLLLGGS